jgi:ribonuclease HII
MGFSAPRTFRYGTRALGSQTGRGRARVFVMGVDENGLGPVLGPLVTTAVGLELTRYHTARLSAVGRELGIDDSKATAAFGRMAIAEGLALAVLEALHGRVPADVDGLLSQLLLDAPELLRDRCPEASLPQCWSALVALPCFGGDVEKGRQALRALAQRGVRVVRAKSAVACTRFLNDRLAAGQSRVEVDLELMERLVLDARAGLGAELQAVCGMVGGIRNYTDKLRHFARDKVRARRAALGTLAYDVEGVGHVRFEIDADQRHLPVALASMIGKYVRELWMLRHNRFYQARDPELLDVSGYHDPVTRRFIAASELLRKRLGVEPACFLRDSLQQLEDRNQLSLFDALEERPPGIPQ